MALTATEEQVEEIIEETIESSASMRGPETQSPAQIVQQSAADVDGGLNPDWNYDENLSTPEGWDIVREPTMEAVAIADRDGGGKNYEMANPGVASLYNDKTYTSSGMTFDEFVAEWNAANDRAPTQKEYQDWIQWGDPGKLYAESKGPATTIKAEDGSRIPVYDEDALSYAVENNLEIDWINDGNLIVLPNTEPVNALIPERFKGIETNTGFEDQFTLYLKEEKADWYEDPYVMAGLSIAAALATAGAAGAAAGAAFGTVSSTTGSIALNAGIGALSSAVGSGVGAELAGGDFLEAAGEGAIKGAITGGVAGIPGFDSLSSVEQAVLMGGADMAASLALDETDNFWESAISAGVGTYAGAEVFSKTGSPSGSIIAEVAGSSAVDMMFGKDADDAIESAILSAIGSFGTKYIVPEIQGALSPRQKKKAQGES